MKSVYGGNVLSLEDLANEDGLFLFDTCALISPYGTNFKGMSIEEKIRHLKLSNRFLDDFSLMVFYGENLLTTRRVLEEFLPFESCDYKHKNKFSRETHFNPLVNELRRLREERYSLDKSVRDSFEVRGKVVRPNDCEEDIEKQLINDYGYLKDRYCLHETDFDILTKGLLLSSLGNPVTIVSNDMGIFYSRDEVIFSGEDSFDDFGLRFVRRTDYFEFEEMPYFDLSSESLTMTLSFPLSATRG